MKNDFEYNTISNKKEIEYSKLNLSKVQEDIIKLINDKPSITQSEIALKLNKTSRMIRYYISELVANGYIKRDGTNKNGKWIINIDN